LAKLTDAAERRAEEQRRRWEEEEERRRREEAERRNREARKASIDQLLAIINRWGVARRIEDFFQEAELRAADSGRDDRDHLLARLRRARGLVGGTDPLGSLRPVALSG
jgi:GTP1/Obg family GTP-binding protein